MSNVLSKDLNIVTVAELARGQPICTYERCAAEGNAICPMLWHNGTIMPKRTSKKSIPTDISQLARAVVEEAMGESLTEPPLPKEPFKETREKNPAAVALGKLGGKKGGDARARKLSPEQRKAIAQKAARARWDNRS
jgi:hypothetical protein